jgi:hypothetical protein
LPSRAANSPKDVAETRKTPERPGKRRKDAQNAAETLRTPQRANRTLQTRREMLQTRSELAQTLSALRQVHAVIGAEPLFSGVEWGGDFTSLAPLELLTSLVAHGDEEANLARSHA